MSNINKVNIAQKMALFSEHWSPKIVGELDNYHIKAVKFVGDFVWHHHEDTDEMFLVIDGSFTMKLRDGDIHIQQGEFIIIPKGVEHCPSATEEVQVLLFEKAGTVNTGNATDSEKTVTELEQL
ncbi:MAG: cupin domain-containing protein [Phototrophicaceae bacterium]